MSKVIPSEEMIDNQAANLIDEFENHLKMCQQRLGPINRDSVAISWLIQKVAFLQLDAVAQRGHDLEVFILGYGEQEKPTKPFKPYLVE